MLMEATPGWCPADQLTTLYELVCSLEGIEGDIVEIGSWCGRSAAVLGFASQKIGSTKVYCVDLFPELDDWKKNVDGTYSFSVSIDGVVYRGCEYQTVWSDVFHRDIVPAYSDFGSPRNKFWTTIRTNGLQDVITEFKGTSGLFVRSVESGFRCKLAFIDGEHSYEAVADDILNVEPLLVDGGLLCFDDAFSEYKGVDRAVREFVIESGLYADCRQVTRKMFIARKTSASPPCANMT